MHKRKYLLLGLLGMLFLFGGEYAAARPCFRGKPYPECRSFWITETSVSYRLNDHGTNHWKNLGVYEKFLYSWELGRMKNLDRLHALGSSVFLDYDDYLNSARFGARFRYRRWISQHLGLDFAPGIILAGGVANTALSLCGTINAADLIALSLRLDVEGSSYFRRHHISCFGGLKSCSYPGLIIGIAGPVIAGLIWGQRLDMLRS